MSDVCEDNRFEIIEAYKKKLIEDTNIETRPEEMAVIDNILFRFWQMGWLPSAQPERMRGKWKEHKDYPNLAYLCSECNYFTTMRSHFCPNCGADMRGEQDEQTD